jgi:hypothetical protein
MTNEERNRVLEQARTLLAQRPERYVPPEPLLVRKRYDPTPDERDRPRMTEGMMRRQREAEAAQQSDGWNHWLETRLNVALAAERKAMLRAVVKIVGQSLGETISEALAAERNAWERKLRELRLECAKLSATLDSLHDIIGAERAKTLDLPALPRRSDLN